jgi:hypothetical protein
MAKDSSRSHNLLRFIQMFFAITEGNNGNSLDHSGFASILAIALPLRLRSDHVAEVTGLDYGPIAAEL